MKEKYVIGFVCFIIFLIVVFGTVVIYSSTKDNSSMSSKIEEELSFVEHKLIEMMNSLNNISFDEVILSEEKGQKGSSGSGDSSSSSDSSKQDTSSSEKGQEKASQNSSQQSQEQEFSKYSINQKNVLTTEDTNIDWDFIKNSVENLYPTWTTIMIDLHSANVKNEDILGFSENLNLLIVYIGQEDKLKTLNTLLNLYNYIPEYAKQAVKDTKKTNLIYTRLYVANSYVLSEEEKWDEMKEKINKAQEYYSGIINSINDKNSQNKISQIYVSLNETNSAINYKDKKLYYIKYIDLMENLLNL